jgi:D-3-phosphoglycerate dehydrogenase
MPHKVLVTDHLTGDLKIEREVLAHVGVDLAVASATDAATLAAEATEAVGFLVTYAQVPASVIEAAPHCRVIARYGIGYDNVDTEAASRAGIVVTNVPDYCLDEVADHTLALLLSLARQVTPAAVDVRAGGWGPSPAPVRRLAGRRLALVGVGGIGRRVAQRARAFGLEVVGYDPYLDPWDVDGVARAADLEDALAEADYVSLHAPLTDENRGLIGADAIASMRRAPIVVNTARGGLVDLEAITEALQEGRVRGVALDVTDPEPPPADHPLRTHPQAVITPHIAFYSEDAQAELLRRAAQEVRNAIEGLPPDRPVNLDKLRA